MHDSTLHTEARKVKSAEDGRRMVSELRAAAEGVIEAIRNPGPQLRHHVATMRRHREEWPRLWERLDALAGALDDVEASGEERA